MSTSCDFLIATVSFSKNWWLSPFGPHFEVQSASAIWNLNRECMSFEVP